MKHGKVGAAGNVAVVVMLVSLARQGDLCGDGWTDYAHRCYKLHAEPEKTYYQAQLECVRLGAQLASVTSQEEEAFLVSLIPDTAWIGLERPEDPSCTTLECRRAAFVWSDGSEYNYTKWEGYYPGDVGNCGVLLNVSDTGVWGNNPCDSVTKAYICEKDKNDCSPNRCVHGECYDVGSRFVCACPPHYMGARCEEAIDACWSNPCVRGACSSTDAGFVCACDAGYEGKHCDRNADDCFPNPCSGVGACTDGVAAFTCTCDRGFTGERCEHVDECYSNPCVNGGTCVDGTHSFSCTCPEGSMGERCQVLIDDCDPSPCVNGTCSEEGHGGEVVCTCDAGFQGDRCDMPVELCEHGWRALHGRCYQVATRHLSYDDALRQCEEAEGGSLASIHNNTVHELVQSLAAQVPGNEHSHGQAWIGLRRPAPNVPCDTQPCLRAGWAWSDGSAYDWSQWPDDQPQDNSHQCAVMSGSSGWQGLRCGARRGYVCEKAQHALPVTQRQQEAESGEAVSAERYHARAVGVAVAAILVAVAVAVGVALLVLRSQARVHVYEVGDQHQQQPQVAVAAHSDVRAASGAEDGHRQPDMAHSDNQHTTLGNDLIKI